jgi:hypothetical protein
MHVLVYSWTEDRKQLYIDLMSNFLLPCPKCTRERDKIMAAGMSERLAAVNSVDDAKRWVIDLHNRVNVRLGQRVMLPDQAVALWDGHYMDTRMIDQVLWYIQKIASKFADKENQFPQWIDRIVNFLPMRTDSHRTALISWIADHRPPVGRKFIDNVRAWTAWNRGWIGLYRIIRLV